MGFLAEFSELADIGDSISIVRMTHKMRQIESVSPHEPAMRTEGTAIT